MAHAAGKPGDYPVKTRKIKRSTQSLWLLCATTNLGDVWLTQRPATGVWAGLYTQPLFNSEAELLVAVPAPKREQVRMEPAFVHVLTHKDLHLHACHVRLTGKQALGEGRWFSPQVWPTMGLPAPVRKLLEKTHL